MRCQYYKRYIISTKSLLYGHIKKRGTVGRQIIQTHASRKNKNQQNKPKTSRKRKVDNTLSQSAQKQLAQKQPAQKKQNPNEQQLGFVFD